MPFSPEQVAPVEDTLNRLATESILAQPGRDDGLVPAYSLLSELKEMCATEPALGGPAARQLAVLEGLLDTAQPFTEVILAELRRFVEWFPAALENVKNGAVVGAFDPIPVPAAEAVVAVIAGVASPADNISLPGAQDHAQAPTGPAEAADVLLDLHLEENQELLSEFHIEAVDHLHQIEAALLLLDQSPDNPEALASIFRSFHTIKGNAGFLGLVPMHTLAHEVESLLDLARNRQLRLNAAIITEILHSRDALSALTQQVAIALEKGQLPDRIIPVTHLIRAVKKLASGNLESAPVAGKLAPAPASISASIASTPTTAPAPVIVPFATTATTSAAAPAPAFAPTPLAESASAPAAAATTTDKAHQSANATEAAATGKSSAGHQTVRVSTSKLDSLMDVVGELVIVQSQILETSRTAAAAQGSEAGAALQRNVAQLARITKELQHTAMSLRMIPIKPTFQKMERLARDLARDFGKKVSFVTDGEDTELDRTVVEEIGDPLVHMVRNALDHGLELPADRIAGGKPETGELWLKAYHQGSNIVIELQDDGRGIDPERIYRKAVEKGVIAAGAQLSREDTMALIFAPGFSTAEKVTAVSGRGVGMDVVKRNIEKLRGKIEIESEVGRGSTFKIKLPLTMAIIDGLVVRVGEDRFILPSTSVQMALRPVREQISTISQLGEVLDLRGKFVPIHRLDRRFRIAGHAANPWDGIVVIVEHSGRTSALLVDEMVTKQEVVIKNLGAFMQNLPGVAGGAILGDGNIALILDPGTLLQAA